ncbi:hypothetical protein PBI_SCTP2_500 [Salicola phage SCTP-2]|nr:hypothetical protein PBI_SCTP2_500 [Salicola phage SCTP-2]
MKFINEKSRLLNTIQSYIDGLEDIKEESSNPNTVQAHREKELIQYFKNEIIRRINNCYTRYNNDVKTFWNNKKWWQSAKKAPKIETYRGDIVDLCKEASTYNIAVIPYGWFFAESSIFNCTGVDECDTNLYSIINAYDGIKINALYHNMNLDNLPFSDFSTNTQILYVGNKEFVKNNTKHGHFSAIDDTIKYLHRYYDNIEKSHGEYIEFGPNDRIYATFNEAKHLIEEFNR